MAIDEKGLIDLFGERVYRKTKEYCLRKIKMQGKDESYLEVLLPETLQYGMFFDEINRGTKEKKERVRA